MELSTWSGFAGGLEPRFKPLLAFVALIAAAALPAAGTVRKGAGPLMDVLNPAFWTFVAVIAGIYAIMALGLYVQFSLAGLAEFRPRRLHGGRRLHHGDPGRALRGSAAAGRRSRASSAAVVLAFVLGIPTLRLRADYLAIATVAGGEIIRYLAMNLPDLTGGPVGSIGHARARRKIAMYNGDWQAMLGRASRGDLVRPRGDAVTATRSMAAPRLDARRSCSSSCSGGCERSPWGRVLKGIREDDVAVAAVGKNVVRLQDAGADPRRDARRRSPGFCSPGRSASSAPTTISRRSPSTPI